MKKSSLFLLAAAVFTMTVMITPTTSTAEVNVSVSIPLPGLVISSPPDMAVVPGTYVYYPPEVSADIFFYEGHWYRPYREGWYISNGYNGPWRTVGPRYVPRAVMNVPHEYRGMHPQYNRIAHDDMRRNWRGWEREKHWDHDNHNRGHAYGHDKVSWNDNKKQGGGHHEDHGEHGRGEHGRGERGEHGRGEH